jgi:hypothetical protein
MEVDRDGNVKAQGEDVKQVLVNGKKFFGRDPKIALQNLPADAVKSVQVYDKKSDQAEFSGVDDGEREKTINLELKDTYRAGTFGNAMLGGGVDATDEGRFTGKFGYNRFSKNQQISILGIGNNINQTGFSMEDYMGFTGATQRLQRGGNVSINIDGNNSSIPLSQGNAKGYRTTWASGVNFNHTFSKKSELNLSYFFNDQINQNVNETFRQNFLPTGNFNALSNADSRVDNANHRVNMTFDQKIDTFTTLKLTSTLSFTENNNLSKSINSNKTEAGIPQSDGNRNSVTNGEGLNMTHNLLLRRRFAKKGRNASASLTYGLNDRENLTNLDALNQFYLIDGSLARRDTIKQNDSRVYDRQNYGLNLSYTEPLAKRLYLEANYALSTTNNETEREVNRIRNGEWTFDPNLSTNYNNDYLYQRGGLTLRANQKEFSISTGLQYQQSQLRGNFITPVDTAIRQTFKNFLPNVRFDFNPVQGKSLRFYYETSMREPSIDQLQPIRDNTDPLNLTLGNPDLRPEYSNRFTLGFNQFNPSTFIGVFGNLIFNYTLDKISNEQTIDASFRRTSKPINVKNDINTIGFVGFTMPLIPQKLRMNANVNVMQGRGIAIVNGVENITQRLNPTLSVRLSLNLRDTFDLSVNSRIGLNNTKYSLQTSLNQQFYNHTYELDLGWRLPWNLRIGSTIDYSLYTGESLGPNQSIFLWNASLSKFILKNRRGEIKLAAVDILNRNRGIDRFADVNYITDQRTNSLGRYVMVSFTYAINPMMGRGGRGGGGMRMMMMNN